MTLIFRAAAVALLALVAPASAEPFRIATGEYAPMTGENIPNGGVVNGLVSKLAETAGVEIEYEYMPWNRGLELTRAGQISAASYWNRLSDQTGLIEVGPVSSGQIVFFQRSAEPLPEWQTLDDLAGTIFGATLGYPYSDDFWAKGEDGTYKIQTAQNDISNFRKLLNGRVDAFIINELVGWDLLRAEFTAEEIAQLSVSATPVSAVEGYLQVSSGIEGGAEIAQRLQAAYDALEASGELANVRKALRDEAGLPGS